MPSLSLVGSRSKNRWSRIWSNSQRICYSFWKHLPRIRKFLWIPFVSPIDLSLSLFYFCRINWMFNCLILFVRRRITTKPVPKNAVWWLESRLLEICQSINIPSSLFPPNLPSSSSLCCFLLIARFSITNTNARTHSNPNSQIKISIHWLLN